MPGEQGLVNNLISIGLGREAAFSAAVLGDNTLMEKAWQETGMLAEAVLHAHAQGRPALKSLVQSWNKMLQKEMEHAPSTKADAADAFLASLAEPKLTGLAEAGKKPAIEILPPGMPSLAGPISVGKKPTVSTPQLGGSQQQVDKPLMLEAPPAATAETSTKENTKSEDATKETSTVEAALGETAPTEAASGEAAKVETATTDNASTTNVLTETATAVGAKSLTEASKPSSDSKTTSVSTTTSDPLPASSSEHPTEEAPIASPPVPPQGPPPQVLADIQTLEATTAFF